MAVPIHAHELSLTEEQIATLKKKYGEVIFQLENSMSLYPRQLEQLRREMRLALESQNGITDLITAGQINHHLLWLQHADNAILNLPWRLAVEDVPHLYLANGLANGKKLPLFTPTNPLPLKILVMISSPEDGSDSSRLSFEREEDQIIQAFKELYAIGKVQIDFTEDGSLQELERKLNANHYHILHFSGHSVYREEKGYLLLEDAITMESHLVAAEDFARALSSKPEHLPTLVLLSSCQSAQGSASDEFKGITNRLLELGVPAVIAMGLSVRDAYATQFAGELYRMLALEEPLYESFKTAIDYIRLLERQLEKEKAPGQWMIPQLFFSQPLEQLVDWKAAWSDLQATNLQFITGKDRLFLDHQPGYQFIGRRRERRQALQPLLNKETVLLLGQGGVGKTALAEHLVQRMMLQNSNAHPFLFNEQTTSFELILQAFMHYLENTHRQFFIKKAVGDHSEKAIEQFEFLLDRLSEVCKPIFVFDNLESFQQEPGGDFAKEFADVIEMLIHLCRSGRFPVLLTSRYPLPAFNGLMAIDLHQVRFADFWRKCQQLSIRELQIKPLVVPDFSTPGSQQIILRLYQTLGGNYRALDFFDSLYRNHPQRSFETLEKLDEFIQEQRDQIVSRMNENLIFRELLGLLSIPAQHFLLLLKSFRKPVLLLGLQMQAPQFSEEEILIEITTLVKFTLVELHQDIELDLKYYYVTPLVKDFLQELPPVLFSQQSASDYYYFVNKHINYRNYSDQEQAFYHSRLAGDLPRIGEIGDILSSHYYDLSLFSVTFNYAQVTLEMLGERALPRVNNMLGLVLDLYGRYDQAFDQFQQALWKCRKSHDRSGEGATLNNIGSNLLARGNYESALTYLNQSLLIRQEICDRKGEIATLSNISQIYQARADYVQVMKYLNQSLCIAQETNDRSGEGGILNNLGLTAYAQGNYDQALNYFSRALLIAQKTGSRPGESNSLNNIGQIYQAHGDYDQALDYMEQSLRIQREIGDRKEEGNTLNNISQVHYARGDYDQSLNYLRQSLGIQQEIGDRKGESTTLNNISLIYHAYGDYAQALNYMEKSLHIQQEIGDRKGEHNTLNNISQIYYAQGNYNQALNHLEQCLSIQREIGDRKGEGYTLNNMGLVFKVYDNYDEALSYLEQSLAIHEEIGYRMGESMSLGNIGQIHFILGNFKQAMNYLERSLRIQQEIGDRKGESTSLGNIGQIFHALEESELAINYLEQSLSVKKEIGDASGIASATHAIGTIYFDLEKFEKALFYFIESHRILKQLGSPNAKLSEEYLSEINNKIGAVRYKELLSRQN